MTANGASLCQLGNRWGNLVLAVSLAATVLGCGSTSRNPAGADATAGKGAAVSGMDSGGEPATGGMIGGAPHTAGGTGGSGSAPIAGTGGSGSAPIAGTGGSGFAGAASVECTGEPWPQGCAPTCDKPMAGCLLTDADALPTKSVSIEAEVVSAETLAPGAKAVKCIGFQGPTTFDDPSTLISLKDADGKTWSLWFPTGLVLPTRFAQGTTLQISYLRESYSILAVEQQLVVREADEVVLFVEQTSRATLPAISGLDLTLSVGDLACPWTADACSEARAHTIAKVAAESIIDPCGSQVGGLSVSSLAHLASGRTCATGVCDVTSTIYKAGVRSEQ